MVNVSIGVWTPLVWLKCGELQSLTYEQRINNVRSLYNARGRTYCILSVCLAYLAFIVRMVSICLTYMLFAHIRWIILNISKNNLSSACNTTYTNVCRRNWNVHDVSLTIYLTYFNICERKSKKVRTPFRKGTHSCNFGWC